MIKRLALLLILVPFLGQAQIREKQSLMQGWKFSRENDVRFATTGYNDSSWETVSLPHTWNALDVLDDRPGYYRDTCWYRKTFEVSSSWKDKQVYIRFGAANQDARVYLNGQLAGEHHGGYTAFTINLTPMLVTGQPNVLAVELSNAHNPDVPPVGGDLCHFGGIYREVELIATGPLHIEMMNHGSQGVFYRPVITKKTPGRSARYRVECSGALVNDGPSRNRTWLHLELTGDDGQVLARTSKRYPVGSGEKIDFFVDLPCRQNPERWSPANPVLYTMTATLANRQKTRITDRVTTSIGFRTLELDPEKGFLLNGKPVYIRGVGKHQDYDSLGYAVPDTLLRQDIRWIDAMGANLVRSHYPLSPGTYDEADRQGIMAWVKIPVMDKINHTSAFYDHTRTMATEMVLQHYNHPSVILWGYACEPFGHMDWYMPKPLDPEEEQENLEKTYTFSMMMQDHLRTLDPHRYIANDFHTDPTPEYYRESGLTGINDLNGWNIYQGWYHRSLDYIGDALVTFRNYNPEKPFIIAEYGAGSDPRINTDRPTIFDFSNQYQNEFHLHYLQEVDRYPWITGQCLWTLADFQVESRRDAVPHINSKGLLTADRRPKDSYYIYQSHWSDTPMIHINHMHWKTQWHLSGSPGKVERPISVITNTDSVTLLLNGKKQFTSPVQSGLVTVNVPLRNGINRLEAYGYKNGTEVMDTLNVHCTVVPRDGWTEALPVSSLCINVGQTTTHFFDPESGDTWLPDTKDTTRFYHAGSGTTHTHWPHMAAWEGIREGIDANIHGSRLDPVFQTFLKNVQRYEVKLPPGAYRVELFFTEPFSREQRRADPQVTGGGRNGSRIFDLFINGYPVARHLDLDAEHGVQQAVVISRKVTLQDPLLQVDLEPVEGKPVLCGIKITPQH